MKQISSETEIATTPEQVWSVLTDFGAYPQWNPFIRSITGEARVGQTLDVRINRMRFRPKVLHVVPGRELRWLGHLLVPGLFDGEHRFEIERLAPDRVLFRQSERFTGLLAPLLWPLMGKSTARGFDAMNQALKQRAESA
jgi:hypothetical protein